MKQHLLEKIMTLSVLVKASLYKKGSLIALSAPLSIGTFKVFNKLIEGVNYKDLALPLVCVTVCIAVYLFFFIIDLILGLIASKHESPGDPDWVKSDKLYTSLGKIGGVLLINMIFLLINLLLVVLHFKSMATAVTLVIVAINVLASLYEFHSIGENIKRRAKVKPRLFEFFDKLTSILELRIMSKISKMLGADSDTVNAPNAINTIDPKGDAYPKGEGKK